MKKLLLILFIIPIIGFTQIAGNITSLSFSPQNPTTLDTLYFYADLSFPSSNCESLNQSHSWSGNQVVASSLHCLGMLTAICYDTDTFKLDPIPAGTYTFELALSAGYLPSCTPGIIPNDIEIIPFDVIDICSDINDINSLVSKKLIKVMDIWGKETPQDTENQILLYIYDDGTVKKRFKFK